MYSKIYDFNGNVKKYVSFNVEKINNIKNVSKKKSVAHHILIVDRSGSMNESINDLKETIIKVLAVTDYESPNMLISIVSYSSVGDVSVHCERVTVSEIVKNGSEHITNIRKIRATSLTCISQSLKTASSLINDDEITAITLHSDGYANDPSPSSEHKAIESLCSQLSNKNVFINTIAYSNNSDFQFLAKIASSVSGMCVKATTTKDVYDAIKTSCDTLSSGITEPFHINSNGSEYTIYVNKNNKKIIGSNGDLVVKGMADGESAIIRIITINADQKEYLPDFNINESTDAEREVKAFVMAVFSRYLLSIGKINESKYAMLSTGIQDIYEKHYKALSSNQIADMCEDLDKFLFSSDNVYKYVENPKINSECSILDLIKVIEKHSRHISINIKNTIKHYSRRGVKRIVGSRQDDGTIVVPNVDTMYLHDSDYVNVGSFDINRSNATINMTIPQKIKLVNRSSREEIDMLAGIKLDLTDFKKYTVVGDGEVNLKKMIVRISSKTAFDEINELGVLRSDSSETCEFSTENDFEIDLSKMPVCGFSESINQLPQFEKVAKLFILSKFIDYVCKGKSYDYTDEQASILNAHCVSLNMYVNMPTTTPYSNLEKAISDGEIDSRTSYSVEFGNTSIANTSKFRSTKEFIDRYYEPSSDTGNVIETWLSGTKYSTKTLSSRSKVTKADELQKKIYDEITGVSEISLIKDIEEEFGVIGLQEAISLRDGVKLLAVKSKVSSVEDEFWKSSISPFIFYISSTGLMPDGFDVEKFGSYDDLQKKCPDISMTKSEALEGSFFKVGDNIISIFTENKHFSTPSGVEKIYSMKNQQALE